MQKTLAARDLYEIARENMISAHFDWFHAPLNDDSKEWTELMDKITERKRAFNAYLKEMYG